MGTAKKAKYPIGFYICCITYTFERLRSMVQNRF